MDYSFSVHHLNPRDYFSHHDCALLHDIFIVDTNWHALTLVLQGDIDFTVFFLEQSYHNLIQVPVHVILGPDSSDIAARVTYLTGQQRFQTHTVNTEIMQSKELPEVGMVALLNDPYRCILN